MTPPNSEETCREKWPPRVWLHGSHWWLELRETGDEEYLSLAEHEALLAEAVREARIDALETARCWVLANGTETAAEMLRLESERSGGET